MKNNGSDESPGFTKVAHDALEWEVRNDWTMVADGKNLRYELSPTGAVGINTKVTIRNKSNNDPTLMGMLLDVHHAKSYCDFLEACNQGGTES